MLKASLRASNAHLSLAALACLPVYFPLLVPVSSHDLSRNLSSSTSASSSQRPASPTSSTASHSHTAAQALTLKTAFISLLPLDKLSDSKEKVREAARDAAVAAARTALRLGVTAGTGPHKDKEGPWGYLETKLAEQGFHGKSAKAREQVSSVGPSSRRLWLTSRTGPPLPRRPPRSLAHPRPSKTLYDLAPSPPRRPGSHRPLSRPLLDHHHLLGFRSLTASEGRPQEGNDSAGRGQEGAGHDPSGRPRRWSWTGPGAHRQHDKHERKGSSNNVRDERWLPTSRSLAPETSFSRLARRQPPRDGVSFRSFCRPRTNNGRSAGLRC